MVDIVCGQSVYCSSWEKKPISEGTFNSGGFKIWLVQQTHLSRTLTKYTNSKIHVF